MGDADAAMSELETVVATQAAAIRYLVGQESQHERDHQVLCAVGIIESAVEVAWRRIDGEALQSADAL
jgi:hypothetical protein